MYRIVSGDVALTCAALPTDRAERCTLWRLLPIVRQAPKHCAFADECGGNLLSRCNTHGIASAGGLVSDARSASERT